MPKKSQKELHDDAQKKTLEGFYKKLIEESEKEFLKGEDEISGDILEKILPKGLTVKSPRKPPWGMLDFFSGGIQKKILDQLFEEILNNPKTINLRRNHRKKSLEETFWVI